MEITRTRALRGPNIWSRRTVLEVLMRLEPGERAMAIAPALEARLKARLPAPDPACSGTRDTAPSLALLLAQATLQLQTAAGCAVTFCRDVPTGDPGVYRSVVEYADEAVGRLAFELACTLCQAALQGGPFDLADAIDRLRVRAGEARPGPGTEAVIEAALARGIPRLRLDAAGLIQLGWGSRQRRIRGTATDNASAIAGAIARDADLCRRLLVTAGLPMPRDTLVAEDEPAGRETGPAGDGGPHDGTVVPGDLHELLVVGGRVIAAVRRECAPVVGTGAPGLGDPDAAADVMHALHPLVAARAVEAARTVGLDICGIHVVCRTPREPLEAQGGAIVAVDPEPDLRAHLPDTGGRKRAVADAILGTMFDAGEDGRIPVVAVTGVNGKTTTVRLVAAMFAASGLRVGMTNTDGVFVGGRQIDSGDCSGPRSARSVLLHPDTDAAVLETARGGILREGLGFDRCSVAVVTNIGSGDHLGLDHIDSLEALAAVKRVIVDNVAPGGAAVLNAADPLVAAMARSCPGEVILFAPDATLPGLGEQRARGGRSVHVADGQVVATTGETVLWRMPLDDIPVTRSGVLGFQVQNVLAATAAAWAAAVPWTAIQAALARFDADPSSVPGRFNEFHIGGGTVFADYGHNPDALAALVQALDGMTATRRSIVISAAGDRRDEDIIAQGRIVGAAFDRVLLYQDAAQRGRADGEVMALLRAGLRDGTRVTAVDEIRGEFVAMDRALDEMVPGEICLILIDQVAEALAHLAARAGADPDISPGRPRK